MALTPTEVTHLYESILLREPNDHELQVGQTRTEEALTNTLLAESQVDVQPFILIYQAAFNRIPDVAGLDFWVNTYREGTLNKWDYTAQIVNTPEFHAQFDNIPVAAGITQIYEQALGRVPEQAGLEFWLGLIASGQKTFTDVLYDISQSQEARDYNGAAVDNLLREVAAGNAELDGSVPLPDFTPPPAPEPAPGAFSLTSGLDVKTLAAGQDAVGSTTTYTDGDHLTGTSNNTVFLTLNGTVSHQGILENVDNIVLRSQAGTLVNASGWLGTKNLTLDKVVDDVAVRDLQSSDTQINIVDANKTGQKFLFTYDAQGITDGGANIGVRETFAEVTLGVENNVDAAIKTINLTINDVAGKNSTLADLIGHKTETLNIDGGFAGGKFKITGALDGTLKTIDASPALSDLDLNVSEAGRETLNVKLGSGNDTLRTGNTLKTAAQGADTLDGGAGRDTLIAVFTEGGRRAPNSTNIEVFDLTFNGNATADFRNVDDVDTVIIRQSSNAFRLENLDTTVENIKVNGLQANALHQIEYANNARNSELLLEWTNATNDAEAGTLQFKNVGKLEFVKDGEGNVNFVGLGSRYASDAWQFDIDQRTNPALTELTVENKGKGDLTLLKNPADTGSGNSIEGRGTPGSTWYNFGDIGGTNAVTDLTFKTSNTGDINVRNIRNVAALENLDVAAANGGDIRIKTIGWHYNQYLNVGGQPLDPTENSGRFDPALKLDTVNLTAKNNSDIDIYRINGLRHPSEANSGDDYSAGGVLDNRGATISEFNVKAESDSLVRLWQLWAGDVLDTDIVIENSAVVAFEYWELRNNVNQGSSTGTFDVSGQGEFRELSTHGWGGNFFDFLNQAVKTIDFSGLTRDAVHIDFSNDRGGVDFTGTNGTDFASAARVGHLSSNYTGTAIVDVGNDSDNDNTYGIGSVSNNVTVYRDIANTTSYTVNVGLADGDWVIGGLGDDVIDVLGGNDFVYGGGGHNQIILNSGVNYVVTGRIGTNEIWAGTGEDLIFLNNATSATGNSSAPNVIYDFTTGKDALIIDISDVEAKAGAGTNLVWTHDVDLATADNSFRAAEFQTVNGKTNVNDNVTNVIALSREGNFQDYTDVLTAIQSNGDLELSTYTEWTFLGSAFEVGDALTIAWHDTDGDLNISLAKVTSLNSLNPFGNQTYNFELIQVAELVGQSSWINWQHDLLFSN